MLCNRFEILSDVLTFFCDEHDFPTDHYIIEFRIYTKFRRAKRVRRIVYDYNKANFTQTTFDITLTDKINTCWKQWKNVFLSTVKDFIPTKIVKDTNSPPWIDGEVRYLIRKTYTALRKYRLNKTAERKYKLRTSCQQIKYAIRTKHKLYLAKIT